MKLNKLIITGLLTSSAFMLVAQPAAARDGKAYSGSACVSMTPSINSNNLGLNGRGGIINISTTKDVRVVCPAVRDTGASITGRVRLVDNHTTRDIECILKSISTTGRELGRDTQESSSSFTNVLPLNFNRVRGAGNAAIYFECVIPRLEAGRLHSEIVSYEITEL
ncbi:MAG: hypothetical protein V3V31_12805 [Methylococcales bacterium]